MDAANITTASTIPPQTPTRTGQQSTVQDPASTSSSPTTTKDGPALATTKRKFHKLLEGLTRSPNAPNTADAAAETTAKRIRLEARTRLAASTSANTSPTTAFIQAQILTSRLAAAGRKSTDSVVLEGERKKEPNYTPWSHQKFLGRLKTFADVRLWTQKPEAVGEVAWARRGWICVGVNTVGCKGGCEQRVVVGLRPVAKDEDGVEVEGSEDFSVDVDEELIKRYTELIVTGHDESCLWRGTSCGEDIFRLQIAQPSIWQPQLRERYHSFIALKDNLPTLKNLVIPLDIDTIAAQLSPSFFDAVPSSTDNTASSTEPTSSAINTTALAFALLGWAGSSDPSVATCGVCFRRLGLWLYIVRTHVTSTENEATQQQELKGEDIPEHAVMKLDLVENHRDYCPWINSKSQAMPGSFAGLAAWEILARLVRNNAAFGESSSSMTGTEDEGNTMQAPSIPAPNGEISGENSHGDVTMATPAQPPTPRPKQDKADIEREDKARFARLKELKKMLGFGRAKGKASGA